MAIYLQARRGLLFERFLELWQSLERDGFRARLEYAITERPAPVTAASPEGNGAAPAVPIASRPEDEQASSADAELPASAEADLASPAEDDG
jgi:hypothetical protein